MFMKKTLLCLFALLLSVTVVNAQKVALMKAPTDALSKKEALRVVKPMGASSVPNRIALDSDERLLGFYNSDELDMSGYSSVGLPNYPGDYKAGAVFTSEEVSNLAKSVGGQITKVRFAVFTSIGETTVRVYPVDMTTGNTGEALAEEKVAETKQGWNDVTLTTPVTVEANTAYLICYDYTQISGQTDSAYPLLVDQNVNSNGESSTGFMIYGNLGQGIGWYQMTGTGNLCIQFVVKGGSYIDNDITLKGLTLGSQYVKDGSSLNYDLSIVNSGNEVPSSYTLEVSVDGSVVGTVESPVVLTNTPQTVNGSVALPSGLSVGKHTVSVSVVKINGETPTECVDDDKVESTFYVYSESLPRQMNLVEEHTSTMCGYCPLGHQLMEKLQKSRDDVAVVAIHNSGMGSDPFVTDESDEIASVFMGSGIPSATFNRFYSADDGSVSVGVGYDSSYHDAVISEIINPLLAQSNTIPTFASVNITPSYDESTRQLNITVSGEAVPDFKTFVGDDAALTVYLLEDSVVARQLSYIPYSHYEKDYVHNHVLRDVVSENVFGDAINWTDGTHYSNEYTVTLDDSWKADKMSVVAFIARPVKQNSYVDDLWINNANVVSLTNGSTGINGIVNKGEAVKEVARYGIDGSKISAPVKGINIIKMSDGTTKKVMVAE